MSPEVSASAPTTTGSIRHMKAANPIPLHNPISMFCGLPTMVRAEPTLEPSASAMR